MSTTNGHREVSHWKRLRKEAGISNDLEQENCRADGLDGGELQLCLVGEDTELGASTGGIGKGGIGKGSHSKHWRQKPESGVKVEEAGIDFSFSYNLAGKRRKQGKCKRGRMQKTFFGDAKSLSRWPDRKV